MRIGIYGGTFDPVHYGHLLLAEQCREQCQLDEVRFVPAATPPHKQDDQIAAASHRVHMLNLALAGCPELTVSQVELLRDGPSYTVDTLQQLRVDEPDSELFLLLGMDSLHDFPMWRSPEKILELAHVVAVNRRSQHDPQAEEAALSAGRQIAAGLDNRLQIISMPDIDISATDIRRRVAASRSIRFLTPRPVAMYIAEHQLYR